MYGRHLGEMIMYTHLQRCGCRGRGQVRMLHTLHMLHMYMCNTRCYNCVAAGVRDAL